LSSLFSLSCSSSAFLPSIGCVSISFFKSMILWSSLPLSVIFACPLPDSWSSSVYSLAFLSFAIIFSCFVIRLARTSAACGMSLAYFRHIAIYPIIAPFDSGLPTFLSLCHGIKGGF
jgi:hypothetical protein